jgi:penicillin amidase
LNFGAITGFNITAPGTSAFISQSGQRSKHFDDQVQMFIDFKYKPILFYEDAVEQISETSVAVEQD